MPIVIPIVARELGQCDTLRLIDIPEKVIRLRSMIHPCKDFSVLMVVKVERGMNNILNNVEHKKHVVKRLMYLVSHYREDSSLKKEP